MNKPFKQSPVLFVSGKDIVKTRSKKITNTLLSTKYITKISSLIKKDTESMNKNVRCFF